MYFTNSSMRATCPVRLILIDLLTLMVFSETTTLSFFSGFLLFASSYFQIFSLKRKTAKHINLFIDGHLTCKYITVHYLECV
jgi:hypothetical protein